MSEESRPVHLSTGLPETVLPPVPGDVATALAAALDRPEPERKAAVASVVAAHPRSLEGWATLGELTPPGLEAYAYFRVGYHRGLDALRQAGWRGSGFVRWSHPSNAAFLRALDGLGRMAAVIGEDDEAERCRQFLRQLDPDH